MEKRCQLSSTRKSREHVLPLREDHRWKASIKNSRGSRNRADVGLRHSQQDVGSEATQFYLDCELKSAVRAPFWLQLSCTTARPYDAATNHALLETLDKTRFAWLRYEIVVSLKALGNQPARPHLDEWLVDWQKGRFDFGDILRKAARSLSALGWKPTTLAETIHQAAALHRKKQMLDRWQDTNSSNDSKSASARFRSNKGAILTRKSTFLF